MKPWMSILFAGMGFGLGFFGGINFEKHRKARETKEPEPELETKEVRKIVLTDKEKDLFERKQELDKKFAEDLMKTAGYIPDEDEPDFERDVAEMELYLASHEHPTDDAPEEPKRKNIPRPIRGEEYWSNVSGFDQVELTYYEEDDILCDEEEKIVENPEELIGAGTLNTFGDFIEDGDDEVYARNEDLRTEYRITRIHNSYGRVVQGMDI